MSRVRYLTLEQVIEIHDHILSDCPIRDRDVLDSAVDKPRAGYDGYEIYPTLADKAAALLEGIARNHGFADGNKRTAITACYMFLKINGIELDYGLSDEELADFVVRMIEERLEHQEVTSWVATHFGLGWIAYNNPGEFT